MKIVSLPFRKAIYSALDGNIEYMGQVINVFDEDVQETSDKEVTEITIGNMEVDFFIILTNQTTTNNSSKQLRNDEVSLQIQVKAVYPKNKGNSEHSEKVMDLIIERLFDEAGLFKNIEMEEGFELWKLDFIGNRNLNFSNEDSRVWMTSIDILGHVKQKPAPKNNAFEYIFDFALA